MGVLKHKFTISQSFLKQSIEKRRYFRYTFRKVMRDARSQLHFAVLASGK